MLVLSVLVLRGRGHLPGDEGESNQQTRQSHVQLLSSKRTQPGGTDVLAVGGNWREQAGGHGCLDPRDETGAFVGGFLQRPAGVRTRKESGDETSKRRVFGDTVERTV